MKPLGSWNSEVQYFYESSKACAYADDIASVARDLEAPIVNILTAKQWNFKNYRREN